MEDEGAGRRPKRQKRESSYKSKAFEKFKQLKSGNKKKYEVEELENVYETVDEREYTKKVLERQDDDWIVDDDGSGYVEDGRDIFDDDLDQESIAAAAASSSLKKGVKRKKHVAENAGRGNLHSLISNMPTKRKEEKKLDNDDNLTDLLQQIHETPTTSATPLGPKAVTSNSLLLSAKQAEKDYMNRFSSLKKPTLSAKKAPAPRPFINKVQTPTTSKNGTDNKVQTPTTSKNIIDRSLPNPFKKNQEKEIEPMEIVVKTPEIIEDSQNIQESQISDIPATQFSHIPETQPSQTIIPETQVSENIPATQFSEDIPDSLMEDDDCFDDDFDMSQIEMKIDSKEEILKNLEEEMLREWTNESELDTSIILDSSEIPLTDSGAGKVFRFFWWDAFEDVYKQPGVVFLFGKTFHEKTQSYISCCVAVRNIERRIFFLPRVTEKNSDKPVTSQDVYIEINNSVMKNLQVKNFKARPVVKKYAFSPEIPSLSDYIELRYSARESPVSKSAEGRTFSRVFGTESSYLEILLLDRKIKGPCWLDIANPSPVVNPVSSCKLEIDCTKVTDISIATEIADRPPLVVTAINMRRTVNPKDGSNEIVMLSCVTNVCYSVDKEAPTEKFFQRHFCVFTSLQDHIVSLDLMAKMKSYKATTLQKMHSEKALLNYFINQLSHLDPDLIVGHDLQGYQMNVLCERLVRHQISNFSKLGKIKRSVLNPKKLERDIFLGRLVCDIKIAAKELMRSRSYELDSLCQSVLKFEDGQRIDLEPDEVVKMFESSGDVLKLVTLTMQDTAYAMRIMYSLNIIPLALQITNIAGNTMSKTLMGGRSERNEFLLLHAFSERDYIVPDKSYGKKESFEKKSSRKKPTYSGGLVLDPKVGFYDKFVLLMDFNSLYPSIIQEYNICFTTMPPELTDENMVLPDKSLPPGILPTEIRKLVETRREVKKLMASPDITPDEKMHYHIRQMALKLTANSMYGCLGFAHSRFFAKNLAALITHKGREILTHTKEIVERMNYEVIYGDTDSLMINTNIVDFEQVSAIGNSIKQEVNKLYKQVELDVDGVFKYLLLLKKKKYAAVILTKTQNGELETETEYKGLDIVRRDWSKLAAEAGKVILGEILCDQNSDDRVANILSHLCKIKSDLDNNKVPISMLIITKQLTKDPSLYSDVKSLPHVRVAMRYNKDFGGHFRAGDAIPYVICEDGTDNSATQRAYHVEELSKNENLEIDVKYYLAQQIHPVVGRICEPIEELDVYQIAECLGIDSSTFKKPKQRTDDFESENVTKPEIQFRNVDKFIMKCPSCKNESAIGEPLENNVPILEKCGNLKCKVRPVDHIGYIKNQIVRAMNAYIEKYYLYKMSCEDPMCPFETETVTLDFSGRFPVCTKCSNSVLLKKYTASDLHSQLTYFYYIFDLERLEKLPTMDSKVEKGYQSILDVIDEKLMYCGYADVMMDELLGAFETCEILDDEETMNEFPEGEEDEDDVDE